MYHQENLKMLIFNHPCYPASFTKWLKLRYLRVGLKMPLFNKSTRFSFLHVFLGSQTLQFLQACLKMQIFSDVVIYTLCSRALAYFSGSRRSPGWEQRLRTLPRMSLTYGRWRGSWDGRQLGKNPKFQSCIGASGSKASSVVLQVKRYHSYVKIKYLSVLERQGLLCYNTLLQGLLCYYPTRP